MLKRKWTSIFRIGFIAYAVLLLLIIMFENFILHPGYFLDKEECRKYADKWSNYSYFLPHNKGHCQTWLIERPNKPLLLYLGGNKMDTARQLNWLNSLTDYSVATMNYRGFGNSTGLPSQSNNVRDASAYLEYLCKKLGKSSNEVILVGESLGAGVATQIASVYPVRNLVLLVPFESMINIAQEKTPFLPIAFILKNTYESQKVAKDISAPTAIIAAEKDTLVPAYHAQKLAKAFTPEAKYYEIPGASHNTLQISDGFKPIFLKACELK